MQVDAAVRKNLTIIFRFVLGNSPWLVPGASVQTIGLRCISASIGGTNNDGGWRRAFGFELRSDKHTIDGIANGQLLVHGCCLDAFYIARIEQDIGATLGSNRTQGGCQLLFRQIKLVEHLRMGHGHHNTGCDNQDEATQAELMRHMTHIVNIHYGADAATRKNLTAILTVFFTAFLLRFLLWLIWNVCCEFYGALGFARKRSWLSRDSTSN